jgi:predicted ATPase
MVTCECAAPHARKRIVLTGGPGAGKTAVLELIRQSFCKHVTVLPEAAGIIFGGGFPREDDDACRRAQQRAIYHVQRELEAAAESHDAAVILCDRGTIDGLAYWPGDGDELWRAVNGSLPAELARYDAVIHLRVPAAGGGYNQRNPLRVETAELAGQIDARILAAWRDHPRRLIVEPTAEFLDKARQAIAFLRMEIPACGRDHVIPAVDFVTAPAGARGSTYASGGSSSCHPAS